MRFAYISFGAIVVVLANASNIAASKMLLSSEDAGKTILQPLLRREVAASEGIRELPRDTRTHLAEFVSVLVDNKCHDKSVDDGLRQWFKKNFKSNDMSQWLSWKREGMPTVKEVSFVGSYATKTQQVAIPCNSSWWMPGKWYSEPMWAHCCNKNAGLAKCDGDGVQATPSRCTMEQGVRGACEDDATLLCASMFLKKRRTNCLIYTFGIADQWTFEDYAGSSDGLGCEVHSMDPTTKFLNVHQKHQAHNVHFHYWGVWGGAAANTFSDQGYGSLGGEFLTLDEMWTRLGHADKHQPIDLIKIDCEGCEWETFEQIGRDSPRLLSNVCTIILEIHVAENLQMGDNASLVRMGNFWKYYVKEGGYRFWYIHANPGATYDRKVNPQLVSLGLDPNTCCYEIGLHKPGCKGGIGQ